MIPLYPFKTSTTACLAAWSAWLMLYGCVFPDVHVDKQPQDAGPAKTSEKTENVEAADAATLSTGGNGSEPPESRKDSGMDDDAKSVPTPPSAAGAGGRAAPQVAGRMASSGSGGQAGKETGQGGAAGSAGEAGAPSQPTSCNMNGCAAEYPCQARDKSFTCRGQFVDWAGPYDSAQLSVTDDGTIQDAHTGLEWQRALPQTYPGCTAPGLNTGCTWAEAKAYCLTLSLAGGGWRLPTQIELESIVDDRKEGPAIDLTLFPGTGASFFWTSSPYIGIARDRSTAWTVNFNGGNTYGDQGYPGPVVRCVRGGAPIDTAAVSGTRMPERYTFPSEGVAYDPQTQLTWQRAAAPGLYTQAAAIDYCAKLPPHDNRPWRLPTRAELRTLPDPQRWNPAIDPEVFSGITTVTDPSMFHPTGDNVQPEAWFWTVTPDAGPVTDLGPYAWVVDFIDGASYMSQLKDTQHARCVQ